MIRLSLLSSACPYWDERQIIHHMLAHGYKGFEPRLGWGHRIGIMVGMTAKTCRNMRQMFHDAGLTFSCLASGEHFVYYPSGIRREQDRDRMLRIMDLACDLHIPFVRTFGGEREEGEPIYSVQRCAQMYRDIMPEAAQRKLTILLETHGQWCQSPMVRAVIDAVDHPNMGAVWDIMHTQRFFETPAQTLATLGDKVHHVHGHGGEYTDESKRWMVPCPIGEGTIDCRTPLRLLHDSGWEGFFSIELINAFLTTQTAKVDKTLRQCARTFHEWMDEMDQAVHEPLDPRHVAAHHTL